MKRFVAGLAAAGALVMLAVPGVSQQGTEKKPVETAPVLVAASATSYGEGSSSAVCLLDEKCQGFWTPQSKDGGTNEGLYFQFKEPSTFDGIEIVLEGGIQIIPYLDGMSSLDLLAQETRRNEEQYKRDSGGEESESGFYQDSESALTVEADSDATGDTHFYVQRRIGENLPRKSKSVFIKFISQGSLKVKAVRFYTGAWNQDTYTGTGHEKRADVILALPVSVKTQVSATSVLQPQAAYDPAHLFDSQLDAAWSTDGKTSNGIGASVTAKFETRQDIQGILIWNGYQRSDAHFRANGRVRKLAVGGEVVSVKDEQGMQNVLLSKPVSTDNLTLTIKEIYKGGSYKDVLISELRFLTPDGRIVLPQVSAPPLVIPPKLDPAVDRTYAAFVQGAYSGPRYGEFSNANAHDFPQCNRSSLRLRGNGTFVIYNDYLEGKHTASIQPGVIEGNWEPLRDDAVRLFGKRYRVPIQDQDGYLYYQNRESALPPPRIFQSAMTVTRFNALSAEEQNAILRFLIERRMVKEAGKSGEAVGSDVAIILSLADGRSNGRVDNAGVGGMTAVTGETLDRALKELAGRVKALDPLYVKSDVYSELLLPWERVSTCTSYRN